MPLFKDCLLSSLEKCKNDLENFGAVELNSIKSFQGYFKLCDMAPAYANLFEDEEFGLFYTDEVEELIMEIASILMDYIYALSGCDDDPVLIPEVQEFTKTFIQKSSELKDSCKWIEENNDDDDPDDGEELSDDKEVLPLLGRNKW